MGSTTCWMSFISSRVLTNCQKWLTTCPKVMINWYPINIIHRLSKKSIQSDKYWLSYSVGRVILTEKTHRQTNKQTTTLFLIYNKKNILISPQTRLLIDTENLNLHTLHKYKHTIQGRPPSPPVDKVLTDRPYAQTHKYASAFSTSAFFERGKLISEGRKLSTNQKTAFSFVLLLS